MLPNFASRPRSGTRASPRAAATRSLGPDDSLTHGVLSLRVAGPRGAPRDAKEAGAKVYPLVSFPVRTRRPARVLRGLPAARAEASEAPPHATPAGATLGSAAKSGCLDAARGRRQQISYYNNSTPSTRSFSLPAGVSLGDHHGGRSQVSPRCDARSSKVGRRHKPRGRTPARRPPPRSSCASSSTCASCT